MKAAVFAMIKNEHLYLEDWIQHNLKLGFDEIWLAEDYDSKSHKSITDKYPQVHYMDLDRMGIHQSYRKIKIQGWAFNFMSKFLKWKGFNWLANIDIDEYIELDKGKTLKEVLGEYSDYKGLFLAWKMYGASGRIKCTDLPPEVAYPIPSPYIYKREWSGKMLVNLDRITNQDKYINIHNNFGGVDIYKVEVEAPPLKRKEPKYWKKIWINHYFTKSFEDWLFRLKRGNMNNSLRKMDTFFQYNPDMRSKRAELMKKYGL